MGRCPKDEPTGKNLVCNNALPISEKNWKNLLGGGGGHPPLRPSRVKEEIDFFFNFRDISLSSIVLV